MSTKENQELSELIGQATAGDKAALETVLAGVQDLVAAVTQPTSLGHF